MDLDEIFSCKQITASSLNLYKTKLRILNDNKPIKNINYLYSIDTIKNKIDKLKPNTRRTYIIAITSILRCLTNPEKKPSKKLKKLYDDYSKILDEYNTTLKDQTTITDGTKVISNDKIDDIYNEVKLKGTKKGASKQDQQDYLILSLYTLQPPRRSRDYIYMKVVDKYNEELSKDFNYYDGYKFYFNIYKTRGKYGEVIIEVSKELKKIIDIYIKNNKINNDEYLLTDKNNNDLTKNTNTMTIILNRIFKDKISTSALRRSFLTNKYGNLRDELQADTNAMSTSVDVANNNYIKKNNKE
jgi:hypothetical protein